MSKATVSAPANIAFLKYWGARDLERAIPINPSISMTLETCVTQCTVEVLDREGDDVRRDVETELGEAGGEEACGDGGHRRDHRLGPGTPLRRDGDPTDDETDHPARQGLAPAAS